MGEFKGICECSRVDEDDTRGYDYEEMRSYEEDTRIRGGYQNTRTHKYTRGIRPERIIIAMPAPNDYQYETITNHAHAAHANQKHEESRPARTAREVRSAELKLNSWSLGQRTEDGKEREDEESPV